MQVTAERNTEYTYNFQQPHYECELCHDSEIIIFRKDGYDYGRDCECKAVKINLRRIKNSGL